MTIACWLVCAALFALYCWDHWQAGNMHLELLRRIDSLQADNRALTEALVREQGRPMLFKAPQTEPSQGWFDGKPRLTVKP